MDIIRKEKEFLGTTGKTQVVSYCQGINRVGFVYLIALLQMADPPDGGSMAIRLVAVSALNSPTVAAVG